MLGRAGTRTHGLSIEFGSIGLPRVNEDDVRLFARDYNSAQRALAFLVSQPLAEAIHTITVDTGGFTTGPLRRSWSSSRCDPRGSVRGELFAQQTCHVGHEAVHRSVGHAVAHQRVECAAEGAERRRVHAVKLDLCLVLG